MLFLVLSSWILSFQLPTVPQAIAARQAYPQVNSRGPAPLQVWIDTYTAVKSLGLIPDIPPSILINGIVTYPIGTNTGPEGACSWTTSHCFADDIHDAPTNHIGVSFDDGPTSASPVLYNFLELNNLSATFFMIGSNILSRDPSIFQRALSSGQHIGCHTWSHPQMTTLTDMEILGELGWTNQIIMDQSGGLIPKFWRPPYGDVDNRVRAIASEVFGMSTVIWNHDTDDWCLAEGGGSTCTYGPMTDQALDVELQGYLSGPRSPGLIVLEHDRTERSVNGFVRAFPTLISQGWIPRSIPDLFNLDWYINSIGEDSIIEHRLVGELNETISALIASASASEISTTTSNSASATLVTSVPTSGSINSSATIISRVATASQQSPDPIDTSVSSIGRSLASSTLVFIVSLGASLLFL